MANNYSLFNPAPMQAAGLLLPETPQEQNLKRQQRIAEYEQREMMRKQKEQAMMEEASKFWQSLNPAQKIGMSPVGFPFTDAIGLAGDVQMYKENPEMRSPGNYAMSGLGLLPFVPGVASTVMKKSKPAKVDTSYRMQHQPRSPDMGAARLDDMTGGGEVFPDDIYSANGLRYYGNPNNKFDRESYEIIQKARGNPDMEITIYRAVPKGVKDINSGDFVTPSKTYAEDHASYGYGPTGKDSGDVISKKVKVKDIYSEGNDLNEFGYFPSAK